ncbi:MAG: thioredoxin [Bacteroidetes bacterium]|nr:thioredoxin [Bacteroidota bacterium]
MKQLFIVVLFFGSLISSCSNGQQNAGFQLDPVAFDKKLKDTPNAVLLDVRTPGEYAKGHLSDALNTNWNDAEFSNQIKALNKTEPVFVYCMSGNRSGSAATAMRADGFTQVYELAGGIMKWRAANMPEVTKNVSTNSGMSMADFNNLLNNEKLVLVDFYADWCAPCKKMKPYLDEISRDMAATVTVVRINADEHPGLCKSLNIDAIPVLQVYKNRGMTWMNEGFIDKEEVVKQLK